MFKEPLSLALETTLPNLSISILRGSEMLCSYIGDARISNSIELLAAADILLKQCNLTLKDLDFLAVCAGPGSFTGIRVGLSTVKALAVGSQCRAFGVSILEALALTAVEKKHFPVRLKTIISAGRNQIYIQDFLTDQQNKIDFSRTQPFLKDIEEFSEEFSETEEPFEIEIITDKKSSQEISKFIPEEKFQVAIASDNVSEFIGLRGLELFKQDTANGKVSKNENLLTPLYIQNFRAGQ